MSQSAFWNSISDCEVSYYAFDVKQACILLILTKSSRLTGHESLVKLFINHKHRIYIKDNHIIHLYLCGACIYKVMVVCKSMVIKIMKSKVKHVLCNVLIR